MTPTHPRTPGATVARTRLRRRDVDAPLSPRRPRWPRYVGYLAALWSTVYGALGLAWARGAPGFPFGAGDPESNEVLVLDGARPGVAGAVIAALGVVGAVVGLAMARARGRGAICRAFLAFAWVLAGGLCLVIPDYRLLMLLTRVPFILASPIFGMPGGRGVGEFFPWPRINLAVLVVGGLLWALTAVAYQRRTSGACTVCGRTAGGSEGWTSPERAARWGRWAVAVACVVPCIYAATRIAWAVGWPLGIPRAVYDENQDTGMFTGGLVIALMALGGAVLTLGLVQRWGEVYPRWVWWRAGRRVPPALAVVPASVVAVCIVPAGIMMIRLDLVRGIQTDAWAMTWPAWLWPLWGVALGAATLAYHLRRRTAPCRGCGRGARSEPPTAPAGAGVPEPDEHA